MLRRSKPSRSRAGRIVAGLHPREDPGMRALHHGAVLLFALALAGCGHDPGGAPNTDGAEAPDMAVAALPAVTPALALLHDDPADNPERLGYLVVDGAGFGAPVAGAIGTCGAMAGGSYLDISTPGGPRFIVSTDPAI